MNGHCCEDWTYRGVPCPCDASAPKHGSAPEPVECCYGTPGCKIAKEHDECHDGALGCDGPLRPPDALPSETPSAEERRICMRHYDCAAADESAKRRGMGGSQHLYGQRQVNEMLGRARQDERERAARDWIVWKAQALRAMTQANAALCLEGNEGDRDARRDAWDVVADCFEGIGEQEYEQIQAQAAAIRSGGSADAEIS